jgi:hypothetical protein
MIRISSMTRNSVMIIRYTSSTVSCIPYMYNTTAGGGLQAFRLTLHMHTGTVG